MCFNDGQSGCVKWVYSNIWILMIKCASTCMWKINWNLGLIWALSDKFMEKWERVTRGTNVRAWLPHEIILILDLLSADGKDKYHHNSVYKCKVCRCCRHHWWTYLEDFPVLKRSLRLLKEGIIVEADWTGIGKERTRWQRKKRRISKADKPGIVRNRDNWVTMSRSSSLDSSYSMANIALREDCKI